MSVVDNHLEILKGLVLTRNSINIMVPGFQKRISDAVFIQTQQQLSEVAILRLFNFLPSKFPPSDYTKDVLAIYCGYESYVAFCRKHEYFN